MIKINEKSLLQLQTQYYSMSGVLRIRNTAIFTEISHR